jgi:hypothetical protein
MAMCAGCGIDEAAISVPDAISAIRTFPRRYREALNRIPADALRLRPDPETWSALEDAERAREVLELLTLALPIVLERPDTRFPPEDADDSPSGRPVELLDLEAVLAGIAAASEALATRAEATPWEAWDRRYTVGDDEHAASWIVQHAAHEGSHRLRDIERVGRRVGATDED